MTSWHFLDRVSPLTIDWSQPFLLLMLHQEREEKKISSILDLYIQTEGNEKRKLFLFLLFFLFIGLLVLGFNRIKLIASLMVCNTAIIVILEFGSITDFCRELNYCLVACWAKDNQLWLPRMKLLNSLGMAMDNTSRVFSFLLFFTMLKSAS